MSSYLAIFIYSALIAGLFVLDRRRRLRTSAAIWLPVTYIFLTASRPVSMWLGMDTGVRPGEILDGSPIDRIVYLVFLVLTSLVLSTRWGQVKNILKSRPILLLFITYCLISLLWSDFPFTALKRWVKLVAELMLMLIVATENRPMDALKRFAIWPAYALIPISILFIKYLPHLGHTYDPWSGSRQFTGASYNKNMLGVMCLMTGLGVLWTIAVEWKQSQKSKVFLYATISLLLANLWLLKLSESTAAQSCFAIGAILIILSQFRGIIRYPIILHTAAASMLLVSFTAVFLMRDSLKALGEDSTLTGRTELWGFLFQMTKNPLLGAGYESFWLGPRLESLWKLYWWRPNQAHNGYIEMYINLGWVGLACIAMLLIAAYFHIFNKLKRGDPTASLLLAYIVVAVPFNFTEAAFRAGNLPWILLLLAVVSTQVLRNGARHPHLTTTGRREAPTHKYLFDRWPVRNEVAARTAGQEPLEYAESLERDRTTL